jgi:phosphatidylglycerophosphate synthase
MSHRRAADAVRAQGPGPFYELGRPVPVAANGQVATHLPERHASAVPRAVYVVPLTGLILGVLLLAALAGTVRLSGTGWVLGVSCAVIVNATLASGLSRYGCDRLGAANWVTFARATLAVGVAALVAESFDHRAPVAMLTSLAALALALDAVDGWVARRTRTTHPLGARFDAEADAFLILVLSVYVARSAGAWVLAIGAARYVFLAAGGPLSWMRAALPPRYWRKVVAATQGIVLAVAAADVLPLSLTRAALIVALALLGESFGRDVWWLWSNRHADHPRDLAVVAIAPRWGRMRPAAGAMLTVLSILIVWAALVAPDRPPAFTPGGFLKVPLEGLVLVVLAVILPATGRRILAVSAGLTLTLVVVLKIANYEIFKLFARPFDPLSDISQLSNGTETLRLQVGRSETTLIEVAAVVGIVVAAILLSLAMLRLTSVAARNRPFALRAVALLGGVWALCWGFGAQLSSQTPIASTSSAGLLVDDIRAVQADIHDQGVFAKQISHDPLRNTPDNQLLTALRGKDVLLVFVEAYGQEAVQGTSFSPGVDNALAQGDKRLASAGFSARSGFLTSATFGGLSWLAHSSLQSGLWVKSQLRYAQLTSAKRLTLADAFKRAGWRTVDDVPSNDQPWPEGKSFYHYDKIYDRYQVGYHGPTFVYASMPDQFTYLALQRLELGKTHRRPLFAEIDTVSSHEPWERIPRQIPWNQVGDGSIYKRLPEDTNLDARFWTTSKRVQAAYGRSIVYSMNTLTSFVQHYGKKNLVLIVLGDHQPLPVVSGQGANHDVPISIIAHDPAVLKRIAGWGWGPGLRPRPDAPVWPMSAFRDRFLTAFGPHGRPDSPR